MTFAPWTSQPARHPLVQRGRDALPGLLLAAIVALAAGQMAAWQGGPVMLYALLFGMGLNFLASDARCQPGITIATKPVLRLGVALLGAKVTLGDMLGLGWGAVALAISGLLVTLSGGYVIGRLLRLNPAHALLSAGAVAICGASAALAISAALPARHQAEKPTLLVVVGVTALSTIAMLAYPLLSRLLGLGEEQAGLFFGATIHDVAQVVGAGYLVSDHAAEVAAIVKLMRVACLVPVVMAVAWIFWEKGEGTRKAALPTIPLFLLGFVALVAVNSAGLLPAPTLALLGEVSRGCLVLAVAALGMKTSLKELAALGPRPVAALVGQTLLLAVFALCFISLLGS
ncbi:YeiH family protein [Niveispirillum sp. KHB5.9]|uniref:YeiH family protein n=1 Tax=Niveispirillum sp. KHB5.9 TaxID=3400269 RepID=UPI003A875550